MYSFVRLWWYCATILLWWLVLISPSIHADTMVDPLKIFWVLTNSSYLGMFLHRIDILLSLCNWNRPFSTPLNTKSHHDHLTFHNTQSFVVRLLFWSFHCQSFNLPTNLFIPMPMYAWAHEYMWRASNEHPSIDAWPFMSWLVVTLGFLYTSLYCVVQIALHISLSLSQFSGHFDMTWHGTAWYAIDIEIHSKECQTKYYTAKNANSKVVLISENFWPKLQEQSHFCGYEQTQVVELLCPVFNLREQRDFTALSAQNGYYDSEYFGRFCNAKYVYLQHQQF